MARPRRPAEGWSRNDRLYWLLVQRGESSSTLAGKIQVDPKTVERWIARADRVPHSTTAIAVARALDVEVTYLWPTFGRRRTSDSLITELAGVYSGVSTVPDDLWCRLLVNAHRNIDILGDPGLFHYVPNVATMLMDKTRRHVRVRVIFTDIRVERLCAPLIRCPDALVARAVQPVSTTLIRADDELLIRTLVDGIPLSMAPLIHYRHVPGGPITSLYRTSFDCTLESSDVLRESTETVRVVA